MRHPGLLLILSLLGCSRGDAPPDHEHGGSAVAAAALWTCPMHPSVRQSTPGSCPICGMDLVPGNADDVHTGTVTIDATRRQQAGIRTEPAALGPFDVEVRALGQVVTDAGRRAEVTLRVDGFVESVRVAQTGQSVRAGEVLFTVYSPELNAAFQDLIAVKDLPAAPPARRRLEQWEVPAYVIDEALRTGVAPDAVPVLAPRAGAVLENMAVAGAAVMAGQPMVRLADLDPIWIEAQIPESSLPWVAVGAPVTVRLPSAPGRTWTGTVHRLGAELDPMTRARVARVVVDNLDGVLVPGLSADVRVSTTLGDRLSVPVDAVIHTGPRTLVFVDEGADRLRPVEVTTGARSGERVEILSGLKAGDLVVSGGTFLVAAESRVRSAAPIWAPPAEGQAL